MHASIGVREIKGRGTNSEVGASMSLSAVAALEVSEHAALWGRSLLSFCQDSVPFDNPVHPLQLVRQAPTCFGTHRGELLGSHALKKLCDFFRNGHRRPPGLDDPAMMITDR